MTRGNPPIEYKDKIQIKRRLLRVFKSLVSRNVIEGYNDMSEHLNINVSTVRGAFSLASPYLSQSFLDRLLEVYDQYISRDWLLLGVGNMRPKGAIDTDIIKTDRWMRVAYILQQENIPVPEFSRNIGLNSPSTIYRILQNKVRPSNNTLGLILEKYPEYGRDWLLYGKGEPYVKPTSTTLPPAPLLGNATPYKVEEMMEFMIVPDAAAAGRLTGYGDPDPDGLQRMTLPVDRPYKGNYYIFTVRGASMDNGTTDAICEGDKLLCREVIREYWKAGLHRRTWPYFVFATKSEGIIVKEVIDQDLVNDTITCHSINPDYPDIVLHLEDIVGIYNVVELISRSMKR